MYCKIICIYFFTETSSAPSLVGGTSLLLLAKLEVLSSLQAELLLRLAFLALQPQHDLLGGLGL